ncbi:MAG: dehydrogenase [marine bacterium B5-7]|nr:MAG: dehydrogenase [marine bacterium B5-7]
MRIDTIVIGGGVIGLATATELARQGQEVIVLERNEAAGLETSTRNSGVIHAGIYYTPGSLRARLCVTGKQLLYRFCADTGVDVVRCGKLLVACSKDEITTLKALVDKAQANGVDDLVWLAAAEVQKLEPEVNCVAACLSPYTGVIDTVQYVQALEAALGAAGGELATHTEVNVIEQGDPDFMVHFSSGGSEDTIRCRQLVNAAGLGASSIANGRFHYRHDYQPLATYPARGHYYRLSGAQPFRHLVYPMPDGAWLGTHLTLDTQGNARFGPDNEWIDSPNYTFDNSDERRQRFVDAIKRYWPGIHIDSLLPDTVGVRPKIYRATEPVADFAIHGPSEHGIDGLVALFGIESPGLTSSLAIAQHVAALFNETRTTKP